MTADLSFAYVIDPRFPGGTSSAFASELRVATKFAKVRVFAVSSKMFGGNDPSQPILDIMDELGVELSWDAPVIGADIIVLHNPSFLKFNIDFNSKLVCRHLVVVAHENFLRPAGMEVFDVGHCLRLIERSSVSQQKSIAPVSPWNRSTIKDWLSTQNTEFCWQIFPRDWFNICDFEMVAPTNRPTDRRGRHSRPGWEKFPSMSDMDFCFPEHAVANVILGGEIFLKEDEQRPHWQVFPFRGLSLPEYFDMIDFMVYFLSPKLRESFGRVVAEGIAAGKIVISDPDTARNFNGAVVACSPQEVDKVIKKYIANPMLYKQFVQKAQENLMMYSPEHFQRNVLAMFTQDFGMTS